MYVYTYSQGRGRDSGAHAVRPWGQSGGQRYVFRGTCAESLLGAPDLSRTQRDSGEKFIFIYLKIRCINAGFDPADSLPYNLLKLLN